MQRATAEPVMDPIEGLAKSERYAALRSQVRALLEGEADWLANLANCASAISGALPGLNWAGFYLLRGDELVLGPFQGRPACVRIAVGRGVCGTAAAEGLSQVVPDVQRFPGHIACDARSRSEIVIPVLQAGKVVAVLDLDSDRFGHFDDEDRIELEALITEIGPRIDWARATRS